MAFPLSSAMPWATGAGVELVVVFDAVFVAPRTGRAAIRPRARNERNRCMGAPLFALPDWSIATNGLRNRATISQTIKNLRVARAPNPYPRSQNVHKLARMRHLPKKKS